MKTKEVCWWFVDETGHYLHTYEIIERNKEVVIVLVGTRVLHTFLAGSQERPSQLKQIEVPVAELDTKPFRDDMKDRRYNGFTSWWCFMWEVNSIDDVFIQVARYAPPLTIWSVTVVLLGWVLRFVDRGHGMIRPDFIGKISTSKPRKSLSMVELDGQDRPHQRSNKL